MNEEKRIKFGIDIGALSQELLQVNRLVEENYQKSIQGQANYNSILEKSIELLQKQVDLISQLNQNDLQNLVVGSNNRNRDFNSSTNEIVPWYASSNSPSEQMEGGINSINNQKFSDISISEVMRLLVLVDKAKGTNNSNNNQEEALDNERESQENDILRNIQEDLDNIWEKYSEGITTPIPVILSSSNSSIPINTSSEGINENLGEEIINEGGIGGGKRSGVVDKIGKGGRSAGSAFNSAASLVQEDPNYILAGLVGMIPAVGVGLSMIANKLIREAEQKDIAQHRFRAATGGGVEYGSFVNIGLKDAEAYDKLSGYYSSNVYLRKSDIEFEKGFNVSSGTLTSLLRAFREDIARQVGASVVGVDYLQGLNKRSKIEWKEIRGYSEDYLKILVELNQKQLETIGETNSLINGHIIQGIASLSNKFGDPTILNKVVGNIQSGLQQAKNPQLEALQYYALSKANPGASLWEMQLMKEDPFGRGRGYLSNYLESLLATGNIQDVKFNIMAAFEGLGAHQTENFVNGLLKARAEAQAKGISLSEYLETKDFGNINVSVNRVTHHRKIPAPVDNRYVEEAIPELLRGAGLNIIVSSGYRPGAITKSGRPSRHAKHEAVDIVPTGGTTYEDIREAIYNNPEIYSYMLANNIGLIDETSATGTTRYWHDHKRDHSHFHFGKDTSYADKYKKEMAKRGITSADRTIEYTEYEEKVNGGSLGEASSLISSEAAAATSEVQQLVARASNFLADTGEPLIKLTAKSVNFIEDAVGMINRYFSGENLFTDVSDGVKDAFNSVKEWLKTAVTPMSTLLQDSTKNNTNPQQQSGSR